MTWQGGKVRRVFRTRKFIPLHRVVYGIECAICGLEFRASRNDARYCSTRCRSKAYRQRRAARRACIRMQESGEPLFNQPLC